MQSFLTWCDVMSDLPSLVKILKYLQVNKEPANQDNIITAVREEQALVDSALNKLVARGIVDSRGEYYCYNTTPKTEEFCQKLFVLYQKVLRRPQMEFLIRYFLSRAGGGHLLRMSTLLHVLEKQGSAVEDSIQLLDEKIYEGCIKKVNIIFITMSPFSTPVLIPYYYASRLSYIDIEKYEWIKQWCQESGLSSAKEDYLIGAYPTELTESGIHHIETEKQREVTQVLREEMSRQAVRAGLVPWQAAFKLLSNIR